MAARTVIGLRALLCVVAVALLLPVGRATAEDTAPATTGSEATNPAADQPGATKEKPKQVRTAETN